MSKRIASALRAEPRPESKAEKRGSNCAGQKRIEQPEIGPVKNLGTETLLPVDSHPNGRPFHAACEPCRRLKSAAIEGDCKKGEPTRFKVGTDGRVPIGTQRLRIEKPPASLVILCLHPTNHHSILAAPPDPKLKPVLLFTNRPT